MDQKSMKLSILSAVAMYGTRMKSISFYYFPR